MFKKKNPLYHGDNVLIFLSFIIIRQYTNIKAIVTQNFELLNVYFNMLCVSQV